MKKIVAVAVLGSVLSFSILQAKVQVDNVNVQGISSTYKTTNMSQNDMNLLFDNVDNNQIASISAVEMSETKGESWLGALKALFTLIVEIGDALGFH